jgi:hypothetical protein
LFSESFPAGPELLDARRARDLGFQAEDSFDRHCPRTHRGRIGWKGRELTHLDGNRKCSKPHALAWHAAYLTLKAMTYVDAAVAPLRKTGQIKIHGPAAFERLRKAGQLVARCLDMLAMEVGPGTPTEKIDQARTRVRHGSRRPPATLMYRGYRKSTCTSLNHVVCHGIPGDKPLKDGDIVNIDVTLILRLAWRFQPDRLPSAKFHGGPKD